MSAAATSPWRTFALASVAMFLVSLDATIGFAAYPALRASFAQASSGELSWVLTAYTIIYAALLVPAGRLADLLGRKRLFMLGVAIFTLSSGLCGLAPGVPWLVAARVLQAIGAALLTPTSLALILVAFPTSQRAVAVSLWGAVGGLAAAVGPSAGAVIIELSSWHGAFFINVPIGLLAWLYARASLTESVSPQTGATLDLLGIALLISSVGLLTLGIVQSESWGWGDTRTLGVIGTGLALLAALLVWARGRPHAAIDLRLFDDRNYRYVNLATLVFGVAFTAMFLVCFLFMTVVWGYSLLQAGLAITPGPLVVIPVAIVAGRFATHHGYRLLLVMGGMIYALAGLWLFGVIGATPDYLYGWLPAMLLSGVGVGLVLPALSGAAVAGLPPQRFGMGSALNMAVRQFGSALGVAITVALVGDHTASVEVDRYGAVFLMLVAGGALTALLSLPIEKQRQTHTGPVASPAH